jgi:hypothetical protein
VDAFTNCAYGDIKAFQRHDRAGKNQGGCAAGNASYIQSLRVKGFVPGRVQPPHSGGEVCSAAVLGGDIPRVLGNTVIHSVDCLNKLLYFRLSVKVLKLDGKKGETLYNLSQSVLTVGSPSCSWNRFAMISWPKCLRSNQFLSEG